MSKNSGKASKKRASDVELTPTHKHKAKRDKEREREKEESSDIGSNVQLSTLDITTTSKSSLKPDVTLTLADVVSKSKLLGETALEQSENIVEAFNADVKPKNSCFVLNPAPGRALDPVPRSRYVVGHKNQVAELADPHGQRIGLTFTINPTVNVEFLDTVDKTTKFFSYYGKHLVFVPAGSFALGFSKNLPIILGPGPHVLIDPTFRFDEDGGFVRQSETYIRHSTIHILRVPAGKFAKVWIGTIPKLIESRSEPYVFNDPQFQFDPKDGFVDQLKDYVQHSTIHMIRVPTGKIAKVWIGTSPMILESKLEPYIFNNPQFKFDGKTGFVSTLERYIRHATIHILRIPQGQVAKVWHGTVPKLLESSPTPYVYNDPQFSFDPNTGFVNKLDAYIQHSTIHILRIPQGKVAKVWLGTVPKILESTPEPYVYNDAQLNFDPKTGFIDKLEPYIHHSTIHILRVPSGKVAKVWLGTVAKLLESAPDPYIFNDPQFRLVMNTEKGISKESCFFDAASRYIEHGSIKRIIPHTGEVAITYNNGMLDIRHTPKDGNPIIIDSSTHSFDGFLSVALQTFLFPSETTKQQTVHDNPNASVDDKSMKIFQTRDSLRVGVVLVVAFKIADPQKAITKLGKDGILPHIENIAFADMGKAIQANTAQEVLFTTQAAINPREPLTPTKAVTIQDEVRKNLAIDLEDYGIELVRMNIETLKVLDEEIAKQLSRQSVTSADFTTKQAMLVKEYDIKTTQARLEAETKNILVQQKNQAVLAEAQTQVDKSKREAEASIIAADAAKKATEFQAELYTKYPVLVEIELARIKAEALKQATVYVTPQELSSFFGGAVTSVAQTLLTSSVAMKTSPQPVFIDRKQ